MSGASGRWPGETTNEARVVRARRLDRRRFLQESVLVLGLTLLAPRRSPAVPSAEAPAPETTAPAGSAAPSYHSFEDVWRTRWRWDRVVRSSHARANCVSACSWNLFVREGIVWREEQNAIYEASAPGLPDFNPRGCQKGACYSHLQLEPSRVLHPLLRAGPRGAGRWRRISWEEALTRVADALIDAALEQGTGAIVYDHGTTNVDFGVDTAGEMRFFALLGATSLDSWAGVGDMPHGALQTWGLYNTGGTADDWFRSDCLIVWLANPAYTRIPEAHFLHEMRYRGGKLVVIAPDLSPSAIHADLWIGPRVGSDAALALSVAQVLIEENRIDRAYVREQTDLPLLVREDSGRYLREADLRRGGRDDVLYLWDEAGDRLAVAPGCQGEGGGSIALGKLRPALEGLRRVRGADGREIAVRPLFERLRAHLDAHYRPERTQALTGVAPATVRRLARELVPGRTLILSGLGCCKHYHGDLMQRAQILLMALTGSQGRPGGGLRIVSWWPVAGFERIARTVPSNLPWRLRLRLLWRAASGGFSDWRDFERLMSELVPYRGQTPLMPWLFVHAGYRELWSDPGQHDPTLPRPPSQYVEEALARGWVPIRPAPGSEPRVLIFTGSNPLRRWPAPQIARTRLWPKLRLVVGVGFKMDSSSYEADLVLPAASYYERDSLKYSQGYLPYLVVCERAVEPLGEAKPEWEIFGKLARVLERRARERGVGRVRTATGGEVDLGSIHRAWTDGGRWDECNPRAALDALLRQTPTAGGEGFDTARRRGVIRVRAVAGKPDPLYAEATDYPGHGPLVPLQRFVEGKEPWPTLSGRQQFLLDHPWYVEAGEALPVHKPAPAAGGDHPLQLTGGHTRWSIHATWRDDTLLLRLQRGAPCAWLAAPDAAARGIRDGDRIAIWNDLGRFELRAKVSPAVQPGQVIVYHAWEPYQFPRRRGQQEPVVSSWKPLQLAGGYGQLHYRAIYGAPGHVPRGQRVEVTRVASS